MKKRLKCRQISHTARLALLTRASIMRMESISGVESHVAVLKWRELQLGLQHVESIITTFRILNLIFPI